MLIYPLFGSFIIHVEYCLASIYLFIYFLILVWDSPMRPSSLKFSAKHIKVGLMIIKPLTSLL